MQQFTLLDTTNQFITFHSWWRHYWVDPRLSWDPKDWGGVSELQFVGAGEQQDAWQPDTMIYEATQDENPIKDTLVMNAYSDGSVFKKRSEIVLRRVQAAVSDKRMSETVIFHTDSGREGLRRRCNHGSSTFQDMMRGHSGEVASPPPSSVTSPRPLTDASTASLPAVPTADGLTSPGGARPGLSRQAFANVATDRVRLEDLVTEHELTDSSEVVARRVAAYMDMVASVVLPLAYLLFILIYILSFNSISKDFSGTKFVHEDPSGDTSSSCCYHKGPAQ